MHEETRAQNKQWQFQALNTGAVSHLNLRVLWFCINFQAPAQALDMVIVIRYSQDSSKHGPGLWQLSLLTGAMLGEGSGLLIVPK
jgi:hypothetical protein